MKPQQLLAASLYSLLMATSIVPAQETSEPFKRLDRNKDGKLTKDEFSGPLFDQIDTNKDGIITAKEDQAFTRRRLAGPSPMRISEAILAELDVPYAGTDNPRQRLDAYQPKVRNDDKPLPVIVFIHGGAWQGGDNRGGYGTLVPFVESGEYLGISVGYRLSGESIWPAQIHDCKAGIRWLKANTDLLSMGGSHNNPNSPESKLVGGAIQENQTAARNASPTSYVSKDDPPFLFIHGTNDAVVPFNQLELLYEALRNVGVESTLIPVQGSGHGNFGTNAVAERMRQFFDKHMRGKDVPIWTEPTKRGGG